MEAKLSNKKTIQLTEDGQELGELVYENLFHLKAKIKLVQFDPKFNWSKLDYNYNITYDKKPQEILLVLLGVYRGCSAYFIPKVKTLM